LTNAPQKPSHPAAPTPDILSLLAADHAEVRAAFDEYENMGADEDPAPGREALAQRICRMLTVHATIEEEFFYPAARQAGVDPELLDEAGAEHSAAKALIAEIDATDPVEPLYDAKMKLLGEHVRHHIEEEEDELFAQCRRTGLDLFAIVMPMATRRAELMQADAAAGGRAKPRLRLGQRPADFRRGRAAGGRRGGRIPGWPTTTSAFWWSTTWPTPRRRSPKPSS
jgi:hypothetical protein